jgi:hypothetical protein
MSAGPMTLLLVLLTVGAVSASDKPYVMNHAVASPCVVVPPTRSFLASCYAAVDDFAARVYQTGAAPIPGSSTARSPLERRSEG